MAEINSRMEQEAAMATVLNGVEDVFIGFDALGR